MHSHHLDGQFDGANAQHKRQLPSYLFHFAHASLDPFISRYPFNYTIQRIPLLLNSKRDW